MTLGTWALWNVGAAGLLGAAGVALAAIAMRPATSQARIMSVPPSGATIGSICGSTITRAAIVPEKNVTASSISDAQARNADGHGVPPATPESAIAAPACNTRNSAAVASDGSGVRCAATAASATPAAPSSPASPTFHKAQEPRVISRPPRP